MAMKVDEGTFLGGCRFCLDPVMPELFIYLFLVWGEQNRMKSDLKCTLKCGEQLPKGEPCLVPSAALVAWGWGLLPIVVLQGGMLLLASYSPRTVRPGVTVTWGEILCTVCLSTFPSLNSGLHGPSWVLGCLSGEPATFPPS